VVDPILFPAEKREDLERDRGGSRSHIKTCRKKKLVGGGTRNRLKKLTSLREGKLSS